ncbi:MAG: hypothetical protein H6651_15575 [Ardenticatenales bacterium]|nr:hypothetical protein [Ardenticatenales bacterium]
MSENQSPQPEFILKKLWQLHIAEAARTPSLATQILERGQRLAWRFVHFYRRLWKQPRQMRRFIKLKVAGSLAAAALYLALSGAPAYAATIVVDGTTCTLIDAIDAANTDTAVGGCVAGSGADVLQLPAGATFSYAYEDNASAGGNALPVVTSEITIEGNGSTIQQVPPTDGLGDTMRALMVDFDADLTLNDLTISGFNSDGPGGGVVNFYGSLAINDSTITGNTSNVGGGGVASYGGTATINNSVISNNNANFLGGGIVTGAYGGAPNAGGNGASGGKYNSMTITDSTVSGNVVTSTFIGGGGGITNFAVANAESVLNINTSEITGNESTYAGPQESVTFNGDVTISGNQLSDRFQRAGGGEGGGWGGGVHSWSGDYGSANTNITDSTISGNSASHAGGGVGSVNKYASGTTNITSSTIAGNYAYNLGGGVAQGTGYTDGSGYGYMNIDNSTISGNYGFYGGGIMTYSFYFGGPGEGRSANGVYDELSLNDTTITGNDAYVGGGFYNYNAYFGINRTIISGNSATYFDTGYTESDSPTTTTDNYNLFGEDGSAGLAGAVAAGASDIVPLAPRDHWRHIPYTTLASRRGQTETHLLLAGGLATRCGTSRVMRPYC